MNEGDTEYLAQLVNAGRETGKRGNALYESVIDKVIVGQTTVGEQLVNPDIQQVVWHLVYDQENNVASRSGYFQWFISQFANKNK